MKYLLIPLLLISLNAFAGGNSTGYFQYHPDTDRWSYGTKDKKTGKKTPKGTVGNGKRAKQEAKNTCGNDDDCDNTVKQEKDKNEGDTFLPGDCGVPGGCK